MIGLDKVLYPEALYRLKVIAFENRLNSISVYHFYNN